VISAVGELDTGEGLVTAHTVEIVYRSPDVPIDVVPRFQLITYFKQPVTGVPRCITGVTVHELAVPTDSHSEDKISIGTVFENEQHKWTDIQLWNAIHLREWTAIQLWDTTEMRNARFGFHQLAQSNSGSTINHINSQHDTAICATWGSISTITSLVACSFSSSMEPQWLTDMDKLRHCDGYQTD